MGQLEDMALFVRIVESGGIGKAAEQLNLAKSAVSRRLSELESRLGTPLINRTTRKSSITEAGDRYYHSALKIIDEVDVLNAQTGSKEAAIEGTLKIALPLSFGLAHLTSALDAFSQQYPKLSLQVDFSDRQVDLVEEGFELAVRIGTLKDSSLKAKRLAPIRHCFCASAAYLEKHGIPKQPEDLKQHQLLHYGTGNLATVSLTDKQGKEHRVEMACKIKANNGDFLADMAIQGHGIVCMPTFITWQAIQNGSLVRLFKNYKTEQITAYIVYPPSRFVSTRARLFMDFMTERFGETPYWDEPLSLI